MRFAILNNNYFNQLKYDVITESALNDFYYLNEITDSAFHLFSSIGSVLKDFGGSIGNMFNSAIHWISTPNSELKEGVPPPNKIKEWLTAAKNALGSEGEFSKEAISNMKLAAGGATVLAGIYLLKKFMSRKDKNQKVDSETLTRANALANLPQDQARKMLMQMS